MAIVPEPFAALSRAIGWPEARVLARIGALARAGILTRVGIIVRHRALGWTSNAMVTFALPADRIAAAGRALAGLAGVTLCYQRRSLPDVWPWGLFCMIHARNRPEALAILDRALGLPELAGAGHQVLFSVRCFKQTGARLTRAEEDQP
jgi:siroheme decarboxylase